MRKLRINYLILLLTYRLLFIINRISFILFSCLFICYFWIIKSIFLLNSYRLSFTKRS